MYNPNIITGNRENIEGLRPGSKKNYNVHHSTCNLYRVIHQIIEDKKYLASYSV